MKLGHPAARVDGNVKVTGAARYAYERHAEVSGTLYGWIVGSTIAIGRITRLDVEEAKRQPGVIDVLTAANAGEVGRAKGLFTDMLARSAIQHYDQAIAMVIAKTLEQARAAAKLVRATYERTAGRFDLARGKALAFPAAKGSGDVRVGDFDGSFSRAPVKLDVTYSTARLHQAMMEPYASTATWAGDKLTLWTSAQIVSWVVRDLADTLLVPAGNIRVIAAYVGGGFGGKLWIRADAVLAALASRLVGRPVKVAIARQQMFNNTTHRSATIQRVRIGAGRDGRIDAIAHESWASNLPGADMKEMAARAAAKVYRGDNRLALNMQVELDLPESGAMRAPGGAPGMHAVEVAMDELADALAIDPVELRIINDTQVDPTNPTLPFSSRQLIRCLRVGADRFGWNRRRAKPGELSDGDWLVGLGVSSAALGHSSLASGARVSVDASGMVTVETDMTDPGTGSYTIMAQAAAEAMGVPLSKVVVRLGDSRMPAAIGSVGSRGGDSSVAGVLAACTKLREALAQRAGFNRADVTFEGGSIVGGDRSVPIGEAAGPRGLRAENDLEPVTADVKFAQAAYGAFFCEARVHQATSEIRVQRLLGVFAAGRILNPITARSQLLGGMTMGIGMALMEEGVIDQRFGCFINHDLAEYHVPVHADIVNQEVVMIDEDDQHLSGVRAKGLGELGINGCSAAIVNAVYNACGARIRDLPVLLDKVQAARSVRS
jgi:xanthine dehydrogenase YagR molybdenum-binding subunit